MNTSKDFDALISKAFAEYANEEFGEAAVSEEYSIPAKELRWARLQDKQRRYKKPVWKAYLQRCAAVALIIFTVSAAVFATSVEVRAYVKEKFSEWFNSFMNIFYTVEASDAECLYFYDITYIPHGYELIEKDESEYMRRYEYSDGVKKLNIEISLTDRATVSLNSNTSQYEEIWLGSHSAYVISEKDGENCAVIFGDKDITVYAGGELERDQLIKVAKGINTNEADILGFVRKFSSHTVDLPNVATYEYTCFVKDFDYSQEVRFDDPIVVGIRIPYNWSEDVNSCHRVRPDMSGFQIASGSSVVLFEVDKDFVLDDTFHEAVAHKYAIPLYTFECKKVSAYKTAGGFDSVIYYQYDDADNIFLTAFIRLTDTLIMSIDLNDDSGNTAVMLDILDSVRLGAYDEPTKEEETPVRFNFEKLSAKEQEYYLMLEKEAYAGGERFSGDDALAMRVAVKLHRINNYYKGWRHGDVQYSAYVPDHTKNEIILTRNEVDASQNDWYYSYEERLYNLKLEVLKKQINEGKSEYEKVELIAEYLYENIIEAEGEGECFSISLGVLYRNRGDCNGIAYAFEELCKSVGIEVTTVYAAGSPGHYLTDDYRPHSHAWNMVKVDGKWYHVDISRMMSDRSKDDPFGAYFLVSDDNVKEVNGDFRLMVYGDTITSEAFVLPECPDTYGKEN